MKNKMVLVFICVYAMCGSVMADPQITACTNVGGTWIGGGNGCAWPPGSTDCCGKIAYRGQTCNFGPSGCFVSGTLSGDKSVKDAQLRNQTATTPWSTSGDKSVKDAQLLNLATPVAPPASNVGTLDNHGELDGIYACTVSITDNGTAGAPFTATVSVNGHADGSSVILVAAESKTQQLFGYGNGKIGDVDAHTFHGSTSFSQPFTFKASYLSSTGGKLLDEIALSGTFGLSATRVANLNCIAK